MIITIEHRDYSRDIAIRVQAFSERIEIVPVGSLPIDLSIDEYEEGIVSLVKKRIIADVFCRLGIIEQ